MKKRMLSGTACFAFMLFAAKAFPVEVPTSRERPNIILVMADDQGWGDVGYNGHPHLKTPNLDAMAAEGLRLDRFYAASAVCSPTRASVLTGRNPLRCGVPSWGRAMNAQERTIAQVLREHGYRTGHFGKWHLGSEDGKFRPVLQSHAGNPGQFGFDEWVSGCNFFDINPTLGDNGVPRAFKGDSSDVVVSLANDFIARSVETGKPFLAVVWYASPHVPHKALPADREPYLQYAAKGENYPSISRYQLTGKAGIPEFYGEIAALDRSIGALRARLDDLGVAENTLIWYCSDNGGLMPELSQPGMKGLKGQTWEGGIRVPGIVVWPRGIPQPRAASLPSSTMDIYPTIMSLLGLTETARSVLPIDGQDISALFTGELASRSPIPISFDGNDALIEGRYKLHRRPKDRQEYLLYDLEADPGETRDLSAGEPEVLERMKALLAKWRESLHEKKGK